MIPNQIKIHRVHPDARIPTQGSKEAAGYDLYATEDCEIPPKEWRTSPTGIVLGIPTGYYGKIEARSGMAVKDGISTLAGVIDSDFTGPIKVVLMNHSFVTKTVRKGDRVGQIIFLKHECPELVEVGTIQHTERGSAGFGSTGK